MDPDQTAPIFQQTTKADKFCCEWCFKSNGFSTLILIVFNLHKIFAVVFIWGSTHNIISHGT